MKKTMVDFQPPINLAALLSQSTLDRVRKELLEATSPESLRSGVRGIFQSPHLLGSNNNLPLVTESVIQMPEPGGIVGLHNNEPPETESVAERAKPEVTVADPAEFGNVSMSDLNEARASLYTGHEVKDELVVGPTVWHRPNVTYHKDQMEKAQSLSSYTSPAPLQHQTRINASSPSDATLTLNTILAQERASTEKERNISSVEKSSEAVCVKREPDEDSVVSDVSETVAGLSTDHEVKDEPGLIEKNEECEDSDLSSVIAAQTDLYTDHLVKDELVLGPEVWYRPTVAAISDRVKPAQSVSARTREQLAMACSVQLERLRHDLQPTRICSGEKIYSCEECGQSFKRKSAIRKHIQQHLSLKIPTNRKGFACDFCISTFKTNLLMIEHQKTEHAGYKPAFATNNKRSLQKKNFERHTKRTCHNCSYCSYSSPHKTRISLHERRHTGEKPFQCCFCDFKTSHSNSMKTHLMTHTDDKPFQCSVCNQKCSTRSHLHTHMAKHTGEKRFQCHHCDYKTNTNYHLQRHLKIYTGEKSFLCNICDYKCITDTALRNHQKRHSGELPFKCTKCSYKCISNANLQKHEVIHTGEKPYKCNNCHKRFAFKITLQHHLLIHTGEKDFQCSDCNYKCRIKQNLLRHQRMHSGEKPFECSDCDYKCNRKAQLQQHQSIHNGEKRFQCNHCNYASRRKQYLQSHLQTKHKPFC